MLIEIPKGIEGRTEIVRSYSFKWNQEQFFCSQKAECAVADADRIAEMLHAFCKREVMKAVNQRIAEVENTRVQRERRTA